MTTRPPGPAGSWTPRGPRARRAVRWGWIGVAFAAGAIAIALGRTEGSGAMACWLGALLGMGLLLESRHPNLALRRTPLRVENLRRLMIVALYLPGCAVPIAGAASLFVHLLYELRRVDALLESPLAELQDGCLNARVPQRVTLDVGAPGLSSVTAPDLAHGQRVDLRSLPRGVRQFLEHTVRQTGGTAVLLGGAVRDVVSGRWTPSDYDIGVSAPVEGGDAEAFQGPGTSPVRATLRGRHDAWPAVMRRFFQLYPTFRKLSDTLLPEHWFFPRPLLVPGRHRDGLRVDSVFSIAVTPGRQGGSESASRRGRSCDVRVS